MGLENFDENNTKNIIKDISTELNAISKKNDMILEGIVNILREIIKNQSNIENKLTQFQNDIQRIQAYTKDSAILSSGIQNDLDDVRTYLDSINEHLDTVQNEVTNIKIYKSVENV